MKRISLSFVVFLFCFPLVASAALYEGPEAKACFTEHAEPRQQEKCLQQKKKQSELKMENFIAETNKRIKDNNIGSFNGKDDSDEKSGDVYSKRFLDAQNQWKKYRERLCLAVATEINEDAYDYQSFIAQCEINLNKRHIEEIKMMGIIP